MLKNNAIRLFLFLLITMFVPTVAALQLVDGVRTTLLFGDPVSYLKHKPAQIDYQLKTINQLQMQTYGVEREFFSNLPKSLSQMQVNERKNTFIATLLPLVLRANEIIIADRNRIKLLKTRLDKNYKLDPLNQMWLIDISQQYKLTYDQVNQIDFAELLKRVDIIPPSLAISQAAIESGWGTSRFAMKGNALFGQWTWSDTDEAGIAPKERAQGERHRIKSFAYLIMSVRDYGKNLNSHWAYNEFRTIRANARVNQTDLDGAELAKTLTSYSTRREAYVNDLMSIMRTNNLYQLDSLKLANKNNKS